jgi:hypothetical protein
MIPIMIPASCESLPFHVHDMQSREFDAFEFDALEPTVTLGQKGKAGSPGGLRAPRADACDPAWLGASNYRAQYFGSCVSFATNTFSQATEFYLRYMSHERTLVILVNQWSACRDYERQQSLQRL